MGFGHMMRFGHLGMMGGYSLLFWVLIIVGLIYLFTNRRNGERNNQHNDYKHNYSSRAEEIAKERYAKGEITKEELDEILMNLRS